MSGTVVEKTGPVSARVQLDDGRVIGIGTKTMFKAVRMMWRRSQRQVRHPTWHQWSCLEVMQNHPPLVCDQLEVLKYGGPQLWRQNRWSRHYKVDSRQDNVIWRQNKINSRQSTNNSRQNKITHSRTLLIHGKTKVNSRQYKIYSRQNKENELVSGCYLHSEWCVV